MMLFSLQRLEDVLLQTGAKTINDRCPSDSTVYGDVGVLHQLVIRSFTHQAELVITLLTFSEADINLTTSKGKTAFELAVEVHV